jgi:eukaryotic-like serine/threonine-protein kinase
MTADSIEGTVIAGKYQLVRLLGQGGMGAVYEGRNLATYKRCAVKLLLSPEFGNNHELIKRFFREAKASSIVESDHIVQVYDSGYDPELGWPYMVMEILNGEDLEGTLKRVGPLHPLAAAKVVLQAAIGLAKAHEAGIVHRDIKPANLYVTARDSGDLVIKLLDFGIAKVKVEAMQETSAGLTRTGSMLGTPLYMSPEQVNGASNIDARSDVWSLGIVLFELLSGEIPWSNVPSIGRLMSAIINDDLPLLQDRAPWVAPELAEITHRAISRDLAKRFQNAGELRDALSQILPDGSRLTRETIQGVPPEHRAFAAPRLALSDDGMLRATTRTGLSLQAQTLAAKQTSQGSSAAIAIGATAIVLLVGGFVAYKGLGHSAAPSQASALVSAETAPLPPASAALATTSATPPPEPAVLKFTLAVTPPDADVSVDGAQVAVKDGSVPIQGALGDTRKVRLNLRGRSQDYEIAIVQNGLLPPKIALGVQAPPPSKKDLDAKRAAAAAAAAAAKPAVAPPATKPSPAPAAAAAAPKKDSGLSRNADEFGH